MLDRRKIVDLWHHATPAALVTLVRVEGSSYRRAGAHLLIASNGEYAGSISGGCLEAEVIRKAQWLVRSGQAVVERYSTLFDDTADIPYGLGCGGTVDLLVEPADTPECRALIEAMQASLQGETFHVITSLPSPTTPLRRTIHSQLETHNSQLEGQTPSSIPEEIFEETLPPPQRLIVLGAGDDAQPLVQMAALLGWTVIVADGRAQWARPERFPQAAKVLTLTPQFAKVIPQQSPVSKMPSERSPSGPCALNPEPSPQAPWALNPGPSDAVVIMTHSYEQDRAWLTAILPQAPRYLGLLGARHRSALLVSEAAALLEWSVEAACAGLFAPVGMDLGGDGAEAIALATIAEIQACCEGKLGTSRRLTPQIVSDQIEQGGASRYLQTQCAV